MKKLKALFLLAVIVVSASINISASGNQEYDVGVKINPLIEADSLSEFSDKLASLSIDDIKTGMPYTTDDPDILEEVYNDVIERIESGADALFIPDIDCDITGLSTSMGREDYSV